MVEKNKSLGHVVVEVTGETVLLRGIQASGYDGKDKPDTEALFVLDSLMRASASYGETKGGEKIVVTFPDFYDFFLRRGFIQEGSAMVTPMSTIVKYQNKASS